MLRDDHTLLLAMRLGDEDAAEILWSRYGMRLIAYAASIVGRSDAEDAVQDALLRVVAADQSVILAVEDPPAWLAMLVRRAAINRLRETSRRSARESRRASVLEAGSTLHGHTDTLGALVESLPRRAREMIVLRHVCGLSFAQCALALGANQNTLASRYRDALELLRQRTPQLHAPPPRTNDLQEVAHG